MMTEPVKVLFVCLGNICRSPTAEGVFRAQVEAAGLSDLIEIDSAGTGNWHVGDPPDRRAQAEARARGIDLSTQRARQATAQDLQQFDYVLAMDSQNLADLERLGDTALGTHLGLLLAFGNSARTDVPDPYYEGAFDTVYELIEEASAGLLAHLQKQT